MPIGRGENIGDAYIRIHADGANIGDDIRDSLRGEDDAIRGAGDEHGDLYAEHFAKSWEKRIKQGEMREAWKKGMGDKRAVDEFIHGGVFREFRSKLVAAHGEVGARAGKKFEQDLIRGVDFDTIRRRMNNILPEIARATDWVLEMEAERHAEALRMNAAFDRERMARMRATLDEAYRMNREFDAANLKARMDADKRWELHTRRLADDFTDMWEDAHRMNARWDRQRMNTLAEAYRMNQQFDRQQIRLQQWGRMQEAAYAEDRMRDLKRLQTQMQLLQRESGQLLKGDRNAMNKADLLDLSRTIHREMTRLNIDNALWNETLRDTDRDLYRVSPRWRAFNATIDNIADSMGRGMGRGSRNNFLNLIGSLGRGLVRLGSLPFRAAEGIASMVGEFKRLQALGAGGLRAFVGSFRALPGLAAGLTTFAAVAAGLIIVVPTLISILSLLAGTVTALAGSLAYAAVGGIAAFAAPLAPLIATVGTLALAFTDLSDAQKKALKADTKPLRDSLDGLRQAARGPILNAIGDQAQRLAPILDQFQGSLRGISAAIVDVGDSWLDSLENSDGFTDFIASIQNFLPDAVRRLGDIVGQTSGGLGGLFRGMIPFMRDALRYLDNLTARFSEWANSAKGQAEIKDFFEDAKESLKDVGFFAGQAKDLVLELLGAGKGEGDSLFRSMGDQIQDWVETLRKDPEILNKWFRDAGDFARDVGDAAVAVGKLVDLLDNDLSRAMAKSAFGDSTALPAFFHGLFWTKLIGFIQNTRETLEVFAGGVSGFFSELRKGPLGNPLKGFQQGMQDTIDAMSAGKGAGKAIIGTFKGVADTIQDAGEKVSIYRQALKVLPKDVVTKVQEMGTDTSLKALKELHRQYDLTPKQIKSLVALSGVDLSKRQMRELISGLQEVDRQNPKPRVDVDTSGAGAALDNLQARINRMYGKTIVIRTQHMEERIGLPRTATGGIFEGMRGVGIPRTIGEAGPEAVVPLNRPLSQVDPSVRWLSAIAQGLKAPAMASGGVVGAGKTINVGGLTVVTPNADPKAVAHETINSLVATGY
jgi:hypothetical protein